MTPVDVDHFRYRVLQDAFAEATAIYWRRRADQFRAALPRPGDFPGTETTPEQVAERRRRIHAQIEACELRARYADQYGLGAEERHEVERALREVA
jgi:hypothetical protein